MVLLKKCTKTTTLSCLNEKFKDFCYEKSQLIARGLTTTYMRVPWVSDLTNIKAPFIWRLQTGEDEFKTRYKKKTCQDNSMHPYP